MILSEIKGRGGLLLRPEFVLYSKNHGITDIGVKLHVYLTEDLSIGRCNHGIVSLC